MSDGHRRGLAAGIGAYFIWGLLPLYLKLLTGMTAFDVLAHRVIWSAAVLAVVVLAIGGWPRVRHAIAQPRLLLMLGASTLLIAANWLVYTWAVLNGRALDTSLGYFMLPLLNVALGVMLLKEPFPLAKQVAVGLAVTGVVILTVAHGALPWVSVVLALSFGLYGFVRKFTEVDAITGLFVETSLLAPVGLIWLEGGSGVLSNGTGLTLLLMGSGVATTVPLAMFGFAARRLSLSTIGFLQYLAPSMVFLIAWLGFHEPLDVWKLMAFGLTWCGIAIYLIGGLRTRAIPARP